MEKIEWNDALDNGIKLGTVYGTSYKQNGCNYPIFYYVYALISVESYVNQIPKIKVVAFSVHHESVRKQTIEVLNCLFPIQTIALDNQIVVELLASDKVASIQSLVKNQKK